MTETTETTETENGIETWKVLHMACTQVPSCTADLTSDATLAHVSSRFILLFLLLFCLLRGYLGSLIKVAQLLPGNVMFLLLTL